MIRALPFDSAFDTIFGLPVHALVVHAVVVLVPLSALGAIVIALVPRWSRRFGVLVVLGALAGTGAAFVAERSGRQLASRVGYPETHGSLGEKEKWFAASLLIVTAALWWWDRSHAEQPRTVGIKVLAAIVIFVAITAAGWTIRTGHTGSEVVYDQIIQHTTPGQFPVPS